MGEDKGEEGGQRRRLIGEMREGSGEKRECLYVETCRELHKVDLYAFVLSHLNLNLSGNVN